jgi:cell wall assembly regulator SMI1
MAIAAIGTDESIQMGVIFPNAIANSFYIHRGSFCGKSIKMASE